MSEQDWFRNNEWNATIEKEFYQKLNRSRSQRDQYLVIQALSLSKNHPKVTLRLVDEYFEIRKSDFDYNRALLAQANAYLTLSDIDNAIDTYKSILEKEAIHPNQLSGTHVDYPFLVATNEIKDEYENAVNVLHETKDRCTFPVDHFKWHASIALIMNDKNEALKALDMAKKNHSGFNYHKSLGLVGPEYKTTIKKIKFNRHITRRINWGRGSVGTGF